MERLLDINEVSEWLQLSVNTIYHQRHRREGVGELAYSVGGRLRWEQSELERWLKEQRKRDKKKRPA